MSDVVYHDSGKQVKVGKLLGVFAKRPAAGQVKTRLAVRTSPEWAERVAVALLSDILDRLSAVAARRLLVVTPDEAAPELALSARDRFEVEPQGVGDLGQRLARFFERHLEQGPVVVVGSDSPTMPIA